MTKSGLFLLCAVLSAALLGSPAAGHTAPPSAGVRSKGTQLTVRNLRSGQEITEHTWGVVKLEVGVEAHRTAGAGKKRQRRSPLKVRVDSKEVDCTVLDSSTGYQRGKGYTFKTIGFRVGGPPGPRSVTILFNGTSRTFDINYRPAGRIDFSNLYEKQAFFGRKAITVDWLACYIVKESIKVRVNGKETAAVLSVPGDAPELVEGRMKLSAGLLRAGANRVTISAVDVYGVKQEKERVFYRYPDNRVNVGDMFTLCLGTEESRGGPFYDAVVEGASIVKKEALKLTPGPERMGGTTVVPPGYVVAVRFAAVKSGESTIRTKERQGITDLPNDIATVAVAVSGWSDGRGFEAEAYSAADFFKCELPKGWLKVVDPGRSRKIYGITAYEGNRDDRLALKVSVEYYAPGNRPGYASAEEYGAKLLRSGYRPRSVVKTGGGMLAGRPARVFEREVSIVIKTKIFFSKNIPLIEKAVVLPSEVGFYVLEFRTPTDEARKNQEAFDTVLNSFEPLR
jgi:hypothetical protein